jgi:5-methylcytosine-specific restriction protein A
MPGPTPPPRWPWPADDPRRFARTLTARDFPLLRDEGGRPLCRWCGGPVKPPRRTLCCDACVHELSLRTSTSYLAYQVFLRDKGVCAICGQDTERPERVRRLIVEMHSWHRFSGYGTPGIFRKSEAVLHELWRWAFGATRFAGLPSQWRWEADHVVPVSEGGGGCGLENMRTLCLPCHGKETGRLRRRLNQRARASDDLFDSAPTAPATGG